MLYQTTHDRFNRDDSSVASFSSSSSTSTASSPDSTRKPVFAPVRVSSQGNATMPAKAHTAQMRPSASRQDWRPAPTNFTGQQHDSAAYASRTPVTVPFVGYQQSFSYDPQDLLSLQSQSRNLGARVQRVEKEMRRLQNERDREPTMHTLLAHVEELQKSQARLMRDLKKLRSQQRDEIDNLQRAFAEFRRSNDIRFNELSRQIDNSRAAAEAQEAQDQHRGPQFVMAGTFYSSPPVATQV